MLAGFEDVYQLGSMVIPMEPRVIVRLPTIFKSEKNVTRTYTLPDWTKIKYYRITIIWGLDSRL